ncbi:hypothetical protein CHL76_15235 [Marinococcus halophilus]|uniref:Uncharacterized protein n=1 Tax=Marinococcus halophilus TaxID=1371 RepID=A0A510Y832_MARHA|nr:hypothetical protein [Marinococcus halophilus]OZT78978.1 hypothetical protein CHL76_15235 [Marinococcus halophilus]GEK58577.1 hypothetical protein MHA01_14820 [Marinococcus halophilus]
MGRYSKWKQLAPKQLWARIKQTLQPASEGGANSNSRLDRRRQHKELQKDTRLYKTSLYAFYTMCVLLMLMPFVYFLPWPSIATWLVVLILLTLGTTTTLAAVTIKKQSHHVPLLYMWLILLMSAVLLIIYLGILIYFRFFLL